MAPAASTWSHDLLLQEVAALRADQALLHRNQTAMQVQLQTLTDQQCRTLEEVRELLSTVRADRGRGSSSEARSPSVAATPPLVTRDFPHFNGDALHEWLFRCAQFFEMDGTAPDLKVRLASFHLEGEALVWHRAFMNARFSENYPTWEEYCNAISNRFDPMSELKNLCQKGSVQQYLEEFDVLRHRVKISEDHAVSFCLAGLKDEIGYSIRMFQPKSMSDVASLARLQEHVLLLRQGKGLHSSADASPGEGNFVSSSPAVFKGPDRPAIPCVTLVKNPPLPSYRASSSTTKQGQHITSAELDEKRNRGMCFWCDEKYVPSHHCPGRRHSYALELIPDSKEDEVKILEVEPDLGLLPDHEQREIPQGSLFNPSLNNKVSQSSSFNLSHRSTSSQSVEHQEKHTSQRTISASPERDPRSKPEKGSFDIFRTTNVCLAKLEKPLHVLSTETKRDSKRFKIAPELQCLRSGMVLLKNFINHADQVKVLNKCRELGIGSGGFYTPGYRNGTKLPLQMMCLGKDWDLVSKLYKDSRLFDDAVPPEIPGEFKKLVDGALHTAHNFLRQSSKSVEEIPNMSPDVCIVNFYENNGKRGLHQDRDESRESLAKGLPVVSFSVGDSAEFLYGDGRNADKAERVILDSGDVLIFGGKSRLIFHGVASIIRNTAPSFLTNETAVRPGRLNLTFRQI